MARHRHGKSHRRSSRNIVSKTLGTSVSMVKSTSKKYAPKLKTGLENVGSKVIKSGQQTIPYLQRLTRKAFGAVGIKSGTKRHRRRHR
jgi:hypothetical protein